MRPLPRMSSLDTLRRYADIGGRGADWYQHAAYQVERGAAMLCVDVQRFADLLALFSPRVSVKRNIRLAIAYVQRGMPDGVMVGVRRAVEHYEQTGEIRGPKTSAFAKALTGDRWVTVLDVWMARAFKLPRSAFNRKPVRERCHARLVRLAAERFSYPADMQAAIWCGQSGWTQTRPIRDCP